MLLNISRWARALSPLYITVVSWLVVEIHHGLSFGMWSQNSIFFVCWQSLHAETQLITLNAFTELSPGIVASKKSLKYVSFALCVEMPIKATSFLCSVGIITSANVSQWIKDISSQKMSSAPVPRRFYPHICEFRIALGALYIFSVLSYLHVYFTNVAG